MTPGAMRVRSCLSAWCPAHAKLKPIYPYPGTTDHRASDQRPATPIERRRPRPRYPDIYLDIWAALPEIDIF
eukprot:scaffold226096_cov33-Tisochrysis_lutea.AAC.4